MSGNACPEAAVGHGTGAPCPPAQLPPRPPPGQARSQPRELLRASKSGAAAALERARQRHPRLAGAAALPAERFTLSDAQLVVAREAGLPSWAQLKREIERIS